MIKSIARRGFLSLLTWAPSRHVLREAPQPFARLRPKQLNILREGRERATSAAERRRFDVRINEISAAEQALHAAQAADGARTEMLLRQLAEAGAERDVAARIRRWVDRLSASDIDIVADALCSKLAEQFVFRQTVETFFLHAVKKTRNIKLLIAGVQSATNEQSALALLYQYAPIEHLSSIGVSDAKAGQSLEPHYHAIMADNGVPLELAAALQKKNAKNVAVKFANRCLVDEDTAAAIDSVRKTWTPIMESECAYFSDEEARLDAVFLEWRDEVWRTLSDLFDDSDDGLAGAQARLAFERLLEDAAYIRFREFWAWRTAIWGPGAEAIGGHKRVFVMSDRPLLVDVLVADARAQNAHLEVGFWSPASMSVAAVKSVPSQSGVASHAMPSASLAAMAEENLKRSNAPNRAFDHIIVTASNVRNYIDYAFDLAKKIGPQKTLIVDVHQGGEYNGAAEKAQADGFHYLNTGFAPHRLNQRLAREADAIEVLFRQRLKMSPVADHCATRLLLNGDALWMLSRHFVELQYHVAHLLQLVEADTVKPPRVFFAPGRTDLAMALSDHLNPKQMVDVQFFMTSRSFRYKPPKAQHLSAIDQQERRFLQEKFDIADERFAAFGAPSVELYFKQPSTLPALAPDPADPPRAVDETRRILFVCQPNDAKHYGPVLTSIRRLLESDSRYQFVVKLHSHNSHGLASIFLAWLGADAARQTRFEEGRDIYEAITACDIAVGYSSNSMIEAASLRKGVILIDSPYVEKFMSGRCVGIVSSAASAEQSIVAYFDDPGFRRKMRDAQDIYFAANPGMDAFAETANFTAMLLDRLSDGMR
ncbi:MAG: hypothetical protein GXP04_02325 [Alphaproteobacteria bacterium]|nr:hypothetical protein [Alphaproteobacteria bacterium]